MFILRFYSLFRTIFTVSITCLKLLKGDEHIDLTDAPLDFKGGGSRKFGSGQVFFFLQPGKESFFLFSVPNGQVFFLLVLDGASFFFFFLIKFVFNTRFQMKLR